VKFGYAITCHKAQGSEWKTVFVNCTTHQSKLSSDYFRWLYTAITRASGQLYLLDPPNIKVGSGLKSVSNIGGGVLIGEVPSVQGTSNVVSTTSEEPSGVETFGIPESETFLLNLLAKTRECLKGSGIVVTDVMHSQYQESYILQRGEEFARINIWYNGKGAISQIKEHQLSALGAEAVALLAPIKFIVSDTACESTCDGFSKPFLDEFHQRLMGLVDAAGISFKGVKEQQWSLRYTFVKGNARAIFDVYFNGKHRLTTFDPVRNQCVGPELVSELTNILEYELSQ
jgi:hypothetical protein